MIKISKTRKKTILEALRRKAFYEILDIIFVQQIYVCKPYPLSTFYKDVRHRSYFNAWLRIQKDVLDFGFVEIQELNPDKCIILTTKGLNFYRDIQRLNKEYKIERE